MMSLMKSLLILMWVANMATSNAQGVSIQIIVNGTLYCSPNGRNNGINPSPVFPNATVEVACTPGTVNPNVNNATTDARGYYRVSLLRQRNVTDASIISNCRVIVLTPLSVCNPALPSDRRLVSNLQFDRVTYVLFWTTTYMVPAGFTLQTFS